MQIAYVTTHDVLNSETWPINQPGVSQASYHIAQNLDRQNLSINYVGALHKRLAPLTRLKWSIYRYCFKKDYYSWADYLVTKDYAYQITQKLTEIDPDIILSPENLVPLGYLKYNKPMVLWTDAPLGALINFYPYLSNLCQETIKNIHDMEMATLNQCSLVIYTSEWAVRKAIEIYNIDPLKIKVVNWGANLQFEMSAEEIQKNIQTKSNIPCKLLFMGTDWVRKGGVVAFEVAQALNEMGLPTELTVIGCQPTIQGSLPSFVKVIGFIDKSRGNGLKLLEELIANSHFLILPTIADCSPHSLIEVNSLGVPCLATQVGGIPTIIHDELNGKCFPLNATASDYCNYILEVFGTSERYRNLAFSSFKEYQKRLNWSVASQTVKELILNLFQ